ncbi:hypothetical protein EYF80_023507 [Liparis tanakae]|uniref:Uncharacterized protein n=1 Tax=Liparis tanakae TaxID=230148 RepID=A0A4Z2HMR7_9TELE|nr:hypothetical protein EYF80_023507 [Liparis tanakae]
MSSNQLGFSCPPTTSYITGRVCAMKSRRDASARLRGKAVLVLGGSREASEAAMSAASDSDSRGTFCSTQLLQNLLFTEMSRRSGLEADSFLSERKRCRAEEDL